MGLVQGVVQPSSTCLPCVAINFHILRRKKVCGGVLPQYKGLSRSTLSITCSGNSKPTVATMRWRSVGLCLLALTVVHVSEVQAKLGKTHSFGLIDFYAWFIRIWILKNYNTSTSISCYFNFYLTFIFKSAIMWAASVAHGAGSTSRRSMVMCTSFLECVNTTWSLTATSPSWSFQCTWRGKKMMETLQSAMWWSPSMILLSTSAMMRSLWTACREWIFL